MGPGAAAAQPPRTLAQRAAGVAGSTEFNHPADGRRLGLPAVHAGAAAARPRSFEPRARPASTRLLRAASAHPQHELCGTPGVLEQQVAAARGSEGRRSLFARFADARDISPSCLDRQRTFRVSASHGPFEELFQPTPPASLGPEPREKGPPFLERSGGRPCRLGGDAASSPARVPDDASPRARAAAHTSRRGTPVWKAGTRRSITSLCGARAAQGRGWCRSDANPGRVPAMAIAFHLPFRY